MNSQKTRQHKFVEKFPVPAAILMAIFWMFLFELIEIANQRVRCRNRAGRTLCRNCDYADFV